MPCELEVFVATIGGQEPDRRDEFHAFRVCRDT